MKSGAVDVFNSPENQREISPGGNSVVNNLQLVSYEEPLQSATTPASTDSTSTELKTGEHKVRRAEYQQFSRIANQWQQQRSFQHRANAHVSGRGTTQNQNM